jgi:hypothetical protein
MFELIYDSLIFFMIIYLFNFYLKKIKFLLDENFNEIKILMYRYKWPIN